MFTVEEYQFTHGTAYALKHNATGKYWLTAWQVRQIAASKAETIEATWTDDLSAYLITDRSQCQVNHRD